MTKEQDNERRGRFISERIHERRDRELEARALAARERLENADLPVYRHR